MKSERERQRGKREREMSKCLLIRACPLRKLTAGIQLSCKEVQSCHTERERNSSLRATLTNVPETTGTFWVIPTPDAI